MCVCVCVGLFQISPTSRSLVAHTDGGAVATEPMRTLVRVDGLFCTPCDVQGATEPPFSSPLRVTALTEVTALVTESEERVVDVFLVGNEQVFSDKCFSV